MTKKLFGTDGIRGKVGEFPITPDFFLKIGWVIGYLMNNKKRKSTVIIGKDTRISGYVFESALQSGLAYAGAEVILTGPIPTPAIAYLTKKYNADLGIVISASHNLHDDNGIKLFSSTGNKVSSKFECKIEQLMQENVSMNIFNSLGKVSRLTKASREYINFCKNTITKNNNLSKLKIVLDCAHGATYKVAPTIFKELGINITCIGIKPNGININKNIGSIYPAALIKKVKAIKADIGISFDGDGDRLIMVDHLGNLINGDDILYILATDKKSQKLPVTGVVGTIMSNIGLEEALKKQNIPFIRTKVGDRYVSEQLIQKNWNIGGETSGHIICKNITTTGDGIISALQVLSALLRSGKSLFQISSEIPKYPQIIRNVSINPSFSFYQNETIKTAIINAEQELNNLGRIVVRPSGTEPVIRIMIECCHQKKMNFIANKLVKTIKKECEF